MSGDHKPIDHRPFEGFELSFNKAQMTFKMYLYTAAIILIVSGILILILIPSYRLGWYLIFKYLFSSLVSASMPSLPDLFTAIKMQISRMFVFYLYALPVMIAAYVFLIRKFRAKAERLAKDQHIRGSKIIDPLKLSLKGGDIPLGQIKIPHVYENRHFFIIGRPGVGKTNAISAAINRIKQRNDKSIIYDFKGDYLSKFYDPDTDLIFNPLDTRCLGWNIFNEIKTKMDIDAVAASLIPPAASQDPFWRDAARDVFAGILTYLYQNNKRTNKDIWQAVSSEAKTISEWLKNTPGAERGYTYIQDASGKQALSVLAVMMQFTKSFEYMTNMTGDFSIFEWLKTGAGCIFISSYSDIKDTLRPILSLFIDIVGRRLLSLPDNLTRRVFFMLDEFGTLQRLTTIVNLLTLSRSKGGSVWIGIQDVGQIEKIYGPQLRQAVINACGTFVSFAIGDPTTAKFLSDKIGDREFYATKQTDSMGVEDLKDGMSITKERRTEKLILPSQFQNLPDLQAFIKMLDHDVFLNRFEYVKYPYKQPAFVINSQLLLSSNNTNEDLTDNENKTSDNEINFDNKTRYKVF